MIAITFIVALAAVAVAVYTEVCNRDAKLIISNIDRKTRILEEKFDNWKIQAETDRIKHDCKKMHKEIDLIRKETEVMKFQVKNLEENLVVSK